MSNKNYLIVFISWLAISSFTYANFNETLNRDIIYCPDSIECYKGNSSVSSCRAIGGDKQYWKPFPSAVGWPIGTYYIDTITASYQNSSPTTVSCSYKTHTTFPDRAHVETKVGSNLEALYENWTNWKVNGKSAECKTSNVTSCPLIEKPELLISKSLRSKKDLDYYDTSERINIQLANDDGIPIVDSSSEYFVINYDKAFSACNSLKLCHINIKVTKDRLPTPYYIGSLWVNLEDNLRIISMTQLNNNSPYMMTTRTPFNNTIIFYKK